MIENAYITAAAKYLPGAPVPNQDIEAYLGKFRGLPSRQRVLVLRQNGIKTRHYALDQAQNWTEDLAQMSAKAALDCFGKYEDQPDLLAASSTMGDHLVPGQGSQVHAATRWAPMEVASLQSVCGSSLHALKYAAMAISSAMNRQAVVTGGEFASRYMTASQFECQPALANRDGLPFDLDFLRFTLSDGAAAVRVSRTPCDHGPSLKILDFRLKSYADRFPICMSGGAARTSKGASWKPWTQFPNAVEAAKAGAFTLQQAFNLLDPMIEAWTQHYLELVQEGWIEPDHIDVVLSHTSTKHLKERGWKLMEKAGVMIARHKWFSNLSQIGNIGTGAVFALIADFLTYGDPKPGQQLLVHVPESGRGISGFVKMQVA